MKSITTRLIVLLTLCAAVIIGVGMLVDYRLSRSEILERLRIESRDAVVGAITDIENWLDGVEGATLFLARILEQRDYSQPGLEQMLKNIVENNDDIYGATIALNPARVEDPLGFAPYYFRREGILTYANLAGESTNYQQQAWYTDTVAAGKPNWVEPYFDEGGGEVLMTTYAVPVYRVNASGDRSLYAVVTADIALNELSHYLQRLRIGENSFAILLSRAGIILSTKRPENVMRHYSEIESRKLDLATWREMFQGALNGQTMTRQLECPEVSGSCVFRLGALQSTGWPVGLLYSEREVLAPLHEDQLKTAIIGAATLLLMALAVFLVTRRLTRPLIALSRASDDIARGVLDTPLPRARGEDEVARLIHSFTSMKADLKTYIADLEIVTASRSRLQGELAAARDIQMSMLPGGGEACELKEDFSLWARVRPAKSVGGDLYTYFLSGRQLFLAVGDVSDKGVPAALFMAKAISHIQPLADTAMDPGAAMAQVNNALEQGNDNCMFVTLLLGVLDLDTLQLRFASAGHTPPALLRSGDVLTVAQESGPALGLAPDLAYPENECQLQPGDRLAIFTDGIDEAFNEQAQMFSIEGFNRAFAELVDVPVNKAGPQLFAAIDEFAGEMPQSDDITLMLLQLPTQAGADGGTKNTARKNFPRGPQLVNRVARWLQSTLEAMAIDAHTCMELTLVAEEIVSNVDKYAGLSGEAPINVAIEARGSGISLEVTDRGIAFNPLEQAHRSQLGADIESAEIGGLGVHLITKLTQRQSYRRENDHNVLRVEKDLPMPTD